MPSLRNLHMNIDANHNLSRDSILSGFRKTPNLKNIKNHRFNASSLTPVNKLKRNEIFSKNKTKDHSQSKEQTNDKTLKSNNSAEDTIQSMTYSQVRRNQRNNRLQAISVDSYASFNLLKERLTQDLIKDQLLSHRSV